MIDLNCSFIDTGRLRRARRMLVVGLCKRLGSQELLPHTFGMALNGGEVKIKMESNFYVTFIMIAR